MFESVNFPGWEVVRKIGEGSFGGVYEIQRKLPDGRVETAALKKMSIPRDQEEVYVLQSQSFSGEQITAYFKKQMEELVSCHQQIRLGQPEIPQPVGSCYVGDLQTSGMAQSDIL